jgi:parallel beta-helix repeat protein
VRYKALPLSVRSPQPPRMPPARRRPTEPHRLRDWLATIPMALLVPALIVISGGVGASTPTLAGPEAAAAGEEITLNGVNFPRRTTVQVLWNDSPTGMPLGTSDSHGGLSVAVSVPAEAPAGWHTISATFVKNGAAGNGAGIGSARESSDVLASMTIQVSSPSGLGTGPEPADQAPTDAGEAVETPAAPSETASATSSPSDTPVPTIEATPVPPTPDPTPAPALDPTPSPTPDAASTPAPAHATSCPPSLQALVDGAPSGSTLNVPACTFTETVTITKPLTLTTNGARVDGQGVRTYGFVVKADDVTIDGFEVTGTTNSAQRGAVQVRESIRFTLRNAHIHHTGGACISIAEGSGHQILDSELAYCEQEGFHLTKVSDTLLARNRIHHNNPNYAYKSSWEAGGGKATRSERLIFEANEVYANRGPGIWCDLDCQDVIIRGNRVHHNEKAGIYFEISDGALIEGNLAWENGWNKMSWGWGGGIVVSSSRNAEVRNNVVAWNADGISVISQDRTNTSRYVPGVSTWNEVVGNHVHNNDIILAPQPSDESDKFMLAWLQDWSGGVMFDPGSDNRGHDNRYWNARDEPSTRFAWGTGRSGVFRFLSDFNATPGESAGRYLTPGERDALLARFGIPPAPQSR